MTGINRIRRIPVGYESYSVFGGDVAAVTGVAGYYAGGYTSAALRVNRIDKITFPADTKTTLVATLSSAKTYGAGFANSGVAGYAAGGYSAGSGDYTSGIDKITFPADTKTTLSATLTTINNQPSGFADSAVAGYAAGGYESTNLSRIDKITFPADTKTTLSATLTSARDNTAGFANSGQAGYAAGGYTGSYLSGIDKITFPADTKTTLSATLTSARMNAAGFANSGVAGYAAGGDVSGSFTSGIDKITFAADTKTTLSATLSGQYDSVAGFSDNGTAGYYGGGKTWAPVVRTSAIDKITFPADTKTTISATLTSAIERMFSFADCGVL